MDNWIKKWIKIFLLNLMSVNLEGNRFYVLYNFIY